MQLSSVLRYVGLVPADRAFYEAGMAWKAAGKPSMAFVMLNRFLDLSDAMDDPDSAGALENADFADTDIPFDFHIPQRPFANEDMKEDVRNFVLELSMDQQVEQELQKRKCDHCPNPGSSFFLACLAVCGNPLMAQRKRVENRNRWQLTPSGSAI